jgi:hypothetical protein
MTLRQIIEAQTELKTQLRGLQSQLGELRKQEYSILVNRNTFRTTITLSKENWEKIELSSQAETFIHDSSDDKWIEVTVFSDLQCDIDATKI